MTEPKKRVLIHDADGNLLPSRTCIYCGFTGARDLFLATANRCLPCDKEKHQEYAKANEDRLKEYRRQRYLSKRDAILADQRQRAKRDPDKTRESKRRGYLKHKDARLAQMAKYRDANHDVICARKRKSYEDNREVHAAKARAKRVAMDDASRAEYLAKKQAYYEANKEKIILASKKHYAEHKDLHSASKKRYYYTHREQSLQAAKAWQRANPAKRRAVSIAYAKRHPDRRAKTCRAYEKTPSGKAAQANCRHRRRAAINSTEKRVTNAQLATLRAKAKGVCYYCRQPVPKLEVEHIVPVSRGGKHELSNLVMACKPCNSSKCNLPSEEFARRIGLLLI